jgi:hypothetical protein
MLGYQDTMDIREKFWTEDIFPYNDYIQFLSIMDHIREIGIIDDELKRRKNSYEGEQPNFSYNILTLHKHLKNEMADLFILLFKYLDSDTIKARQEKFIEKEKKNAK